MRLRKGRNRSGGSMFWSQRFRLPLIALLVAVGIHSYSSSLESFDSHASRFLSTLELDVEFPSWTGGDSDSLTTDGSERPASLELAHTTTDANDGFASDSLFGEDEKERGPAIVCLIPNHAEDYRRVKAAIQSLDKHLDDAQRTPLLLFNEGNLPDDKKDWLVNLTKREVHFPEVDFKHFPFRRARAGIQGHKMKGRPAPWGYWQMCKQPCQVQSSRNYDCLLTALFLISRSILDYQNLGTPHSR